MKVQIANQVYDVVFKYMNREVKKQMEEEDDIMRHLRDIERGAHYKGREEMKKMMDKAMEEKDKALIKKTPNSHSHSHSPVLLNLSEAKNKFINEHDTDRNPKPCRDGACHVSTKPETLNRVQTGHAPSLFSVRHQFLNVRHRFLHFRQKVHKFREKY